MIKPRAWQREFLSKWIDTQKKVRDFVAVVCPRGGKSIGGGLAFLVFMKDLFDKCIVVGPTDEVRSQWVNSFAQLNLQLCEFANFRQNVFQFDGLSMTYQQLGSNIAPLLRYTDMHRTLIILDEPHHLGETKSWGRAAEKAFVNRQRMLLLTGTPYRTDDIRIPFIRYNNDGTGQNDYVYSYKQAVIDKVVRPIQFNAMDGKFEFCISRVKVKDGVPQKAVPVEVKTSFKDIDCPFVSERLAASLNPRGDFMPEMVKRSHEKLLSVQKKQQSDAAGLAVCRDIIHAAKIAALIEKSTGKKPVIVTSDDSQSKFLLDKFRRSNDDWIVTVKMVSEGVDIRRLRVLLFVTNVKTSMSFRQVTARPLTMNDEFPGKSYCFLPADPELLVHVREIEKELSHSLPGSKKARANTVIDEDGEDEKEKEKTIKILELIEAKLTGLSVYNQGALQINNGTIAQQGTLFEGTEQKESLQAQINKLKLIINKKTKKLCSLTGKESSYYHQGWIEKGGMGMDQADIGELQEKSYWLDALIAINGCREIYTKRSLY